MENLTVLPNIGKVIAQNLTKSGIATVNDFMNAGAKEAFIKIRLSADPNA